ncbi:hypothetical protein FHS96_002038 [Sphingomonas zeicaulis]|uniref:sialate O-acetylesterase n=1 Tax=Sphingomonas zeicaulis TaxID=1632740 RepID=UPI003D2124CD
MIRIRLPLLIGAALFGVAATDGPDIYLLAGQSNMSGRGSMAELTETERRPDPAIRLYGNDGRHRVAADPVDDATGQVDPISADRAAGIGPGLFFARTMRQANGRPILLIPCAKGGSSIKQWIPGGGRDTLYGSCLARIREVGGKLRGVLWYQGETDAHAVDTAQRWSPSFTAVVARLRADLAQPRLPVVAVQLADKPRIEDGKDKFPGWSVVQQAQAALPGTVKCLATIEASGQPLLPDDLHLTTAAQRVVGARLAQAMRGLIGKGCR